MTNALAPSTSREYDRMYRDYKIFCLHSRLSRFPVTEDTLCLYCSYLARRMGFKAIKSYLSALRFKCIMRGRTFNLAGMDRLYYLLRGIRRVQGISHCRLPRAPITTYNLIQIHNLLYSGSYSVYQRRLYWSASTLAFFGLLRVSEYTCPTTCIFSAEHNLMTRDVYINLGVIRLNIKVSKTDPFRQGCTLFIGPTNDLFCPVAALSRFLELRGTTAGPLFRFNDGTFLTRQRIATLLKKSCDNIRINTHSFRIGGASALSAAGYSDSQIQVIGRWNSNCFVRYLRLTEKFCVEFSQKMANVQVGTLHWQPR